MGWSLAVRKGLKPETLESILAFIHYQQEKKSTTEDVAAPGCFDPYRASSVIVEAYPIYQEVNNWGFEAFLNRKELTETVFRSFNSALDLLVSDHYSYYYSISPILEEYLSNRASEEDTNYRYSKGNSGQGSLFRSERDVVTAKFALNKIYYM